MRGGLGTALLQAGQKAGFCCRVRPRAKLTGLRAQRGNFLLSSSEHYRGSILKYCLVICLEIFKNYFFYIKNVIFENPKTDYPAVFQNTAEVIFGSILKYCPLSSGHRGQFFKILPLLSSLTAQYFKILPLPSGLTAQYFKITPLPSGLTSRTVLDAVLHSSASSCAGVVTGLDSLPGALGD